MVVVGRLPSTGSEGVVDDLEGEGAGRHIVSGVIGKEMVCIFLDANDLASITLYNLTHMLHQLTEEAIRSEREVRKK